MTESRFRVRPPSFIVALVLPLIVGVLLNAVVRPWLGQQLGGTPRSAGASVRGQDHWWEFDAATRAEHPMLTGFLTTSDGAIAMLLFAVIVLLFAWRFLDPRIRVFRARRAAAAARRSSAGS